MREPTFRRSQSLYETVRTIYFHHFSWSHKWILCKHTTTFELSFIYSTVYMAFPGQPLLFTETVPYNTYKLWRGTIVFQTPNFDQLRASMPLATSGLSHAEPTKILENIFNVLPIRGINVHPLMNSQKQGSNPRPTYHKSYMQLVKVVGYMTSRFFRST